MSFAGVISDLDHSESPVTGASLAATLRDRDQSEARLAMTIAAFDESGEWESEGWASVLAWLRDVGGLTPGDAAELIKIGRKLRRWPVTAAAWAERRITSAQVKVICAQVIERHAQLFAEHEETLIPSLEPLTFVDTLTAMRVWRARADALDDGNPPKDEPNKAYCSPTLDGRGHVTASLDAEGYSVLSEALRLADSEDLDVPAPLRRGQALVDIAQWFLDNQTRVKESRRHRPHVNIVIDGATIGSGHLEGFVVGTGMQLPSEVLERYLCDCEMHRVLSADGVVLDYGRAERTPPPDLFNAILMRDHRCRWKGCDRPASWCHAHHVKWWERDFGPTSFNNLVLLCHRHHAQLHRKGWSAVLHLNGDFEVTPPRGQTWVTHAPGRIARSVPPPTRRVDFDELDTLDAWNLHFESLSNEDILRRVRRAPEPAFA